MKDYQLMEQQLSISWDYFQKGQINQAANICSKFILENPNHIEGLTCLGIILRKAKVFQQSLDVLKKAIQLDPEAANLKLELARTLQAMESFQKSATTYQAYLDLMPRDFDVYEELYQTYQHLSQEYLPDLSTPTIFIQLQTDIHLKPLITALQSTFSVQDNVTIIIHPVDFDNIETEFNTILEKLKIVEDETLEYLIVEKALHPIIQQAICANSSIYLSTQSDKSSDPLFKISQQFNTYFVSLDTIPSSIKEIVKGLKKCLNHPPELRTEYIKSLPTTHHFSTSQILKQMENIDVTGIFIWGRSGTFFVQSLLDNHPQILNMPGPKLCYFHSHQWQMLSSLIQQNPQVTPEELCEAFIKMNIASFENNDNNENYFYLGDNKDQALTVDQELFTKYFRQILLNLPQITRKSFFIGAHFAYAQALGQDLSQKKLLFYQIHAPNLYEALPHIHADFPTMKVIGMTRYPPKAYHSFLKSLIKNYRWGRNTNYQNPDYNFEDLVYTGEYNHVYRHQLIGWSYLMYKYPSWQFYPVKLEILHQEPQKTLTSLMDFLNLEWSDTLLDSTYNGLAYWGDSYMKAEKTPLRGFSSEYHALSSNPGWKKNIDKLDIYVLMALHQTYVETYDYGKISWLQKKLLPVLLLCPSKIERRAFKKALKQKNKQQFQSALIYLFERYLDCYKHLFEREIPHSVVKHPELPVKNSFPSLPSEK